MKMKSKGRIQKKMLPALSGFLLTGCLAGCGLAVHAQTEYRAVSDQGAQTEYSVVSDQGPQAEYSAGGRSAAYAIEDTDAVSDRQMLKEQLSHYESFGMTYDAKTNVLKYNGKRVRCFEDYYPVGEEAYGGVDFFDEKGVVDVCAIRDFGGIVRNADGSFDPSGRVVGLRRCTDEEFAARDIEAIKNPQTTGAICGEPPTQEEMEEIAAEYRPFGVTYDAKKDVWYFKGEKVRSLLDVLTSNGEDLDGGGFHGTMRRYWQDDGTADICTVRDFDVKNADGYGTLTGIQRQ